MKKNPYYDPSKAHHTPEGFTNIDPLVHRKEDLKRWQKERREKHLPLKPQQGYSGFIERWWQPVDLAQQQDGVWWLGHASMLVKMSGKFILIDPVFSKRVSPLTFYGPERKTPLPIDIEQLPAIEVLLISHDHYDHLDRQTVLALLKRNPNMVCIVPLGLKRWFTRCGAIYIHELDWWEQYGLGDVTLHFVPARHWSIRTPMDRNRSLWGGWVLSDAHHRFYFAGDSGYTPRLKEIGDRLGPFSLAALPLGAYEPRWFMHPQHMDPADAVRLFGELRCQRAFGMHWGVFELADEALDDPPDCLQKETQRQGIGEKTFTAEKIGSFIPFSVG